MGLGEPRVGEAQEVQEKGSKVSSSGKVNLPVYRCSPTW